MGTIHTTRPGVLSFVCTGASDRMLFYSYLIPRRMYSLLYTGASSDSLMRLHRRCVNFPKDFFIAPKLRSFNTMTSIQLTDGMVCVCCVLHGKSPFWGDSFIRELFPHNFHVFFRVIFYSSSPDFPAFVPSKCVKFNKPDFFAS